VTAVVPRTGGYRHPAPSVRIIEAGLADGGSSTLAESYELCRRIHAAHGRTYYFATRFLPAGRRHHVYALYGFARYADDLVDHMDLTWSSERRRSELERWTERFLSDLERGDTDDPVLKAVIATVLQLDVRHADLRAFLASMAMDLTVDRYATYDDLYGYMHGSAAVIGSMMLPVLGTASEDARARAMDLGVAFQLTNFLRDVAEDWDRGRIYLPLEDLERFGVTEWDFHSRHVGPSFRRLLSFQADRARTLYRRAEQGWALLPPSSRACIRIAHRLYAGILDALEAHDYQVFRTRAAVPVTRKARVAIAELVRPTRPDDRAALDPRMGMPFRRMANRTSKCQHGRRGNG
jgi:15-cis-phytoene synthase